MKNKTDYTLYLCTDRQLMTTKTVEECVELAIKGGCTVVQLREKDCDAREFYGLALRVKGITKRYGVPLIINDRIDIALATDADGVHVGQNDLPATAVRRLIGPDKILGVSVSNLDGAVRAQADGADYLGVGAMYETATQTNAELVTLEELKKIRQGVNLPIVVIGGINRDTAANYKDLGIDGLAVVSAVAAQDDIPGAARELIRIFKG